MMKRSTLRALTAVLVSTFSWYALSQTTNQDAHNQGLNDAKAHNDNVGVSQINSSTASQIPFYKENPLQQSDYSGGFGDMIQLGTGRITQSSTYQSGQCDREGFDPAAVAEDVAGPAKWAGMSPSARSTAIQNQVKYFDQECDGINFLAGEYQTRHQAVIPPTDDIHHWTPDWNAPDPVDTCTIRDVVTPPEYAIEYCYESRTIEKRFCKEDALVQCTPASGDCAPYGIIPGSVAVSTGNYEFNFVGGQLILKNTITSPWTQTQASFSFVLDGLDRIEEFRLVQVTSDNWVGIQINGTYIGTHTRFFGGLRFTSWVVRMGEDVNRNRVEYAEGLYRSAETGNSFTSEVDVDFLPYLNEGENNITMYVIDGGPPGNGTLWINAKQKCPQHCDINFVDNCSAFEAARVDH